jgi:ketosteroid isomerase-like protein
MDPVETDRRFFAALLAADRAALSELLTDDFVIIDVMQGNEIPRAAFLDAVTSGQVVFDAIDLVESRVRRYGDVAVVTGRTEMRGRVGTAPWAVRSRYTHVYVADRLASAQGTAIA